MNRKYRGLVAVVFLFSLTISAFSRNIPVFSTAKTAQGIVVKCSNPAQPFSLLIGGKQLTSRQTADGNLKVTADGRIYTISLVKTSDIVDLTKKPDTEEILNTNREFNTLLQASKMTGAINTTSQGTDSIENIDLSKSSGAAAFPSVYWSTLNEGTFEKKFFQTAVLGDSILTIETAVGKRDKLETVHSLTRRIISSLKV